MLELPIVVPNIAAVRSVYDRVKVFRAAVAEGPFTEISAPGTRITLIAKQRSYSFLDVDGDETYYYRWSFYNTISSAESAYSDTVLGSGASALSVLGVDELKEVFLTGVVLKDMDGVDFPDSLFEFYIKAAVAWVEKKLDIPLRRLVIEDERHDFIWQDYQRYIMLQLDYKPVISVEEIRLVLPTDQEVITYDASWIFPDKAAGSVRIIPGSGQTVIGATSSWFSSLYSAIDVIPDVFRCSYTAGFESGQVPDELRDLVGKVAAIGPLSLVGDMILGPGIAGQSFGLDGLTSTVQTTQSATNSGYGARIAQYNREIKASIADLRRYYQGIRMTSA